MSTWPRTRCIEVKLNKAVRIPPFLTRYQLANARLPITVSAAAGLLPDEDGLAPASLLVENGRIAAISAGAMAVETATPLFDLDGGIVLPAFTDVHTHLDKGHIWPRRRNTDGSFAAALLACRTDRENWSAADLRARMRFGLECAYAHGTSALRTHIDSMSPQTAISWPIFAELREAWRGRVALQASPLFAVELALDDAHFDEIAFAVREYQAMIGAVTYMSAHLEPALERLFRLAEETGSDLDFHVDETNDPSSRSLEVIADMATARRFDHKILCAHCCSLALQPQDYAKRVIEKVARAGIAVVSLPMCNLYLQDRDIKAERTPRWRGVTAVHELKRAGVPVMIASDNTRDPFYAYGDLDMLEVFREATRILHFDHPAGDWLRTITATPATIMGQGEGPALRQGAPADLVAFKARSFTELFARPQTDRAVIRAGRAIEAELPDHRGLDAALLRRRDQRAEHPEEWAHPRSG
ncbi:MAG: cytosine deaminase [Hyphomicrobiales bacterium]|nr:cytosine deaminase [Hyphomicrobiales bacterium]